MWQVNLKPVKACKVKHLHMVPLSACTPMPWRLLPLTTGSDLALCLQLWAPEELGFGSTVLKCVLTSG